MNLRSHLLSTCRLLARWRDFLSRWIRALKPSVLLPRIRAGWAGLHPTTRHFLWNVLVGVAIAVLLHSMHHSGSWGFLHTLEDRAIDWMIDIFSVTEARKASIPLVWIDIDEGTYSAWGEPLYTPRDQLKAQIQRAAEAEPLAVIVDIDLSRADHVPGADQALKDYLAHYPRNCEAGNAAGQGRRCPPIILMRGFSTPPGDATPRVRASFLDPAVAQSSRVFWGSALFQREGDGVIRRWRLWERGEPSRPAVIPSVQLLAYGQLRCRGAETVVSHLRGSSGMRRRSV